MRRLGWGAAAAIAVAAAACGSGGSGATRTAPYRLDGVLHLNQVQLLGTHNSYHVEPSSELRNAIQLVDSELADRVQYTHAPLDAQLQREGVRSVELDVFADPQGGLYARRVGLRLIGQDPESPDPALRAPGFKVMHSQDIDFGSRCPAFVECLRQLHSWSDAHRAHAPVVVLVEPMDTPLPSTGPVQFTVPVPIGGPELDAVDGEIRSVFTPDRLLTPDDIRGGKPRLEDAVLGGGWPTLGVARGKVLFVLIAKRDAYVVGHPALEGRAMFTTSEPGQPDAAVVLRDDPVAARAEITDLVRRGYLVRTRADADTVEARNNQTARRQAALESGAQIVSTDYPVADKRFGPYAVSIPHGAPAGCDPINGPPGCRPADVEHAAGANST